MSNRHGGARELLDVMCRTAAAAIAGTVRHSDTTADHIVGLLRAEGLLPTDGGESPDEYDSVAEPAINRFGALLTDLIEAALHLAVEYNPRSIQRIRTFYLKPQPNYSMEELASLWAVTSDEVRDVFHDELNAWAETHPTEPDALRVGGATAVATNDAFGIVRPYDVERALANDFLRVRSSSWRTVPVLLHLPRFITDGVSSQSGGALHRTLAALIERFVMDCFVKEGLGQQPKSR